MKKLIFLFFCITQVSLFAFDNTDFDFSIKPKTIFASQESESNFKKTGFIEQSGTSIKNKSEVALPDQKLLRGFVRFPKVDAFGEVLPDSFLFYRESLNSNQKSAYDEIYKAVMNAESTLNIITRISKSEIASVVEAVYYDNPETFWWAGAYSYCYNVGSQLITQIVFKYVFDEKDLPQLNKVFFNMSLPILFYANLLDTDMDKMKYVHDYLCLSVEYDIEAFNSGNYGGKLQTAYSAVVEYKTVCAGYSRAFAYYMQQLRIPCTVLFGSGHAWNMVMLDGDCYQLDVTWDDGNKFPPYFNLSHAEMQKIESHTLSDSARAVIARHPSHSDRLKYSNYFGSVPTGKPYTYKEFTNIATDIENPAFAEVYKE